MEESVPVLLAVAPQAGYFGQFLLPCTQLHGTTWVQSMDKVSPAVTWHLLFVAHVTPYR